jgi:hypothetical protein
MHQNYKDSGGTLGRNTFVRIGRSVSKLARPNYCLDYTVADCKEHFDNLFEAIKSIDHVGANELAELVRKVDLFLLSDFASHIHLTSNKNKWQGHCARFAVNLECTCSYVSCFLS